MTFNNEEIKPVAIAIIELRLCEGISKGGSQSVSQSVENSTKWNVLKFRSKYLEWVRNDLKTFLILANA